MRELIIRAKEKQIQLKCDNFKSTKLYWLT